MCWLDTERLGRTGTEPTACPTTDGSGSARTVRTTAGRRRSSWRCRERVGAARADKADKADEGGTYEEFLTKNGAPPTVPGPGICSTFRITVPVPLDEVEPVEDDPPPLRELGDVARRAVAGGAFDAFDRDEPDGRPVQLAAKAERIRSTISRSPTATGSTIG